MIIPINTLLRIAVRNEESNFNPLKVNTFNKHVFIGNMFRTEEYKEVQVKNKQILFEWVSDDFLQILFVGQNVEDIGFDDFMESFLRQQSLVD